MSEGRIVGCFRTKINFATNYNNFKTIDFYNVQENKNTYIIVNITYIHIYIYIILSSGTQLHLHF
jgi:hypothetical protein